MAEFLGLAASIIRIADAGVALSTTLFNLGSANRADADIADIANDVKLTANALYNVGRVIENEDGQSGLSGKATQDASKMSLQCETLFNDIRQIADKRRKSGRDGKRRASTLGRPVGLAKEESVELLKKRLENSTDSLMLMQHILHLANEQAKGEVDESILDREREKIRETHQRQQESLKALQCLEGRIAVSDDDTLQGSNASSRIPTIEFLMNTPGRKHSMSLAKNYSWSANSVSTSGYLSHDSHSSDSDHTMTEDEAEFLTPENLVQCAAHVQKLLKHLASSQQTNSRCPKYRVHKWYRHFCRKFESSLETRKTNAVAPAAPFPGFRPPQPIDGETTPPREAASTTLAPRPLTERDGPPHKPHPQPSTQVEYQDRTEKNVDTAQPTKGPPLSIAHPHHSIIRGDPGPEVHSQFIQTAPAPTFTPTNALNEAGSREGSKEDSQSGVDLDNMLASQGSGSVHYTKTGRVSKAKKGLKVHACTECGKSFTRAEHLRRHQKNHSSDQVSCQLCGKVFFRVDLLMRHVERHKDGPILNASTPGARSSMSPQEGGQNHRSDERYHRSTESAEGDQPPQWYYIWNEAEKRYDVQHANRAMPPPTEQVVEPRPDQGQPHDAHPQTQEYITPRISQGSVKSPQIRNEVPRPHPDEHRRYEGAFHQSPPSPIRSPPSPWVKETRTLPPLRPLPSQVTFNQSRDSTAIEASMTPISPALQQQSSAISTLNRPVSVNTGTRGPPILPRPVCHDRSHKETAEGPSQSERVQQRQEVRCLPSNDLTWPKAKSPEDQRRYSCTDPAPSLSKSQSTSPSAGSVFRTYPNPIRPHEARREVSLGRLNVSQDLPSPSQNINPQPMPAAAQDATAAQSTPRALTYGSQTAEGPQVDAREHQGTWTQRDPDGREAVLQSSDAVSGKRKKGEEEIGQAGQAGEVQGAESRARDNKRQRLEDGAGGNVTSDRKDRPKASHGKDIVDVLLKEWTDPA